MTEEEYFQLWVLLNRTRDVMSRLRQAELKPYRISEEQAGILLLLRNSLKNPTPAEISRWLFRRRSTVTVALKRMVAKGLIAITVDPSRKNRLRVALTKKGIDLSKKVRQDTRVTKIISNLSDSQCHKLRLYLGTLLIKAESESESESELTSPRDKKTKVKV
jgi:DNA-binding MarR family transcriptional regulator